MLYSGVGADAVRGTGDGFLAEADRWRRAGPYGGCSSGVERWTVAPEAAGSKPVIHPSLLARGSLRTARGQLLSAQRVSTEAFSLGWHCAPAATVSDISRPRVRRRHRVRTQRAAVWRVPLLLSGPLTMIAESRWRLDGARAVVTGGTRGIGLAMVLRAARARRVGGHRRTRPRRSRSAADRGARRRAPHASSTATSRPRTAAPRWSAAIPAAWDALDILVNNVGTNVRTRSLDVNEDDYRRILDTNVTCAWELSRALHPRLAASGRGAIVNVGSVAGQVSVGTGAVYAMSKAAHRAPHALPRRRVGPRRHPRQRGRAVVHPHAAGRADPRRPRDAGACARGDADGARR